MYTLTSAGLPKKDASVCTIPSALKDGVSQTEHWLKGVSSKMIQTLLQSLTDSSTQTTTCVGHDQTVQVEMVPTTRQVETEALSPPPPPTSYRPIVFHRQVQTEPEPALLHRQIQTDKEAVLSRQVQTEPGLLRLEETVRKSIAVGDGAINDVLCERCTLRRTRHVSCGTDFVRPAVVVNVATQSYTPYCQVGKKKTVVFVCLFRNKTF